MLLLHADQESSILLVLVFHHAVHFVVNFSCELDSVQPIEVSKAIGEVFDDEGINVLDVSSGFLHLFQAVFGVLFVVRMQGVIIREELVLGQVHLLADPGDGMLTLVLSVQVSDKYVNLLSLLIFHVHLGVDLAAYCLVSEARIIVFEWL